MNELFEPVPNILSRRIGNENLRERLSHYANALDELVSIATYLLNWEFKDDFDETNPAYAASGDEIVIIGVTFKRILELMDAVAIQVRHGAIVTATVHLRVLFELSVQLEHILVADSHRRCQCIEMVLKIRTRNLFNFVSNGQTSKFQTKVHCRVQS